jgi:hypothetical protein
MFNIITESVLNWRPYPVNASLDYRRLWTWLEFRLKGRERRAILSMLRAFRELNRVHAAEPQRVEVFDFAHFVVEKPFQRFDVNELTEEVITGLVDNGKLERNTDFTRFPVTRQEIESFGLVAVIQLDGIARDAYTVRIPMSELVRMTALLLDVAHDDYGLVAEDLEVAA